MSVAACLWPLGLFALFDFISNLHMRRAGLQYLSFPYLSIYSQKYGTGGPLLDWSHAPLMRKDTGQLWLSSVPVAKQALWGSGPQGM